MSVHYHYQFSMPVQLVWSCCGTSLLFTISYCTVITSTAYAITQTVLLHMAVVWTAVITVPAVSVLDNTDLNLLVMAWITKHCISYALLIWFTLQWFLQFAYQWTSSSMPMMWFVYLLGMVRILSATVWIGIVVAVAYVVLWPWMVVPMPPSWIAVPRPVLMMVHMPKKMIGILMAVVWWPGMPWWDGQCAMVIIAMVCRHVIRVGVVIWVGVFW